MALKINLKSGDSLFLGTSKFTILGEGYTTVLIEGDTPVLRESECIRAEDAQSLEQQALFFFQQFYLSGNSEHLVHIRELQSQMEPAAAGELEEALMLAETGNPFGAIKHCRRLAVARGGVENS